MNFASKLKYHEKKALLKKKFLIDFRECLQRHIVSSEDTDIKCPSNEGYECDGVLTDSEIRALVSNENYDGILKRRLNRGLATLKNIFNCKTVNCEGVCEYEDNVNFFDCPLCRKKNCLTCKAIHEGMTCKQYQDDLNLRAQHDINARKDKEAIEVIIFRHNYCIENIWFISNFVFLIEFQQMIQNREAMYCPGCKYKL